MATDDTIDVAANAPVTIKQGSDWSHGIWLMRSTSTTITVYGSVGGTTTLTVRGQTTGAVAYNATAADVQAAVGALPLIGAGNVRAYGGPWPIMPIQLKFVGDLLGYDVGAVGVSSGSLIGGTPVVTTLAGGAFDPTVLGWQMRAMIRDSYADDPGSTVLATCTCTLTTGRGVASLTAAQTRLLPVTYDTLWHWDAELFYVDAFSVEHVDRVVSGPVTVSAEVTR